MSLGPQCGKPRVATGLDAICVDVLKEGGKNRIVTMIKKKKGLMPLVFFWLYLALSAGRVGVCFFFFCKNGCFLFSLAFHPHANPFVFHKNELWLNSSPNI